MRAAVPLVLVAVAQPQIEHRGRAVPKLRREGRREEVRIRQGLVVHNGHRPASRSRNREVVGVGQVHTLHAPQHAAGAVAAHHDVVAAVVRALHAREVARHAGRVATRTGVPVGLLHREGPGAHRRHLVHHLPFLRCRNLCRLNGHHALLQVDVQHHRPATRQHDAFEHPRLVAHEGHLQRVAPQGHVFQLEPAVQIRRCHLVWHGQHLHRRPHQGVARLGVHHTS